ncbi:39S ribosomal protein L51, mitochondrial [Coelomomyces lativittatus]|nr:39S ribosomal protein L51, mitochondrial [Coelomomyces lativittatus]KAJ1512738.1 39S ribosomal protein L51, mitochondrial [Coelomomyces lativittatus]KAJ1513585.1 39S ribosomal protein L51, mitochondrial [Coelomomyces lativittatus]
MRRFINLPHIRFENGVGIFLPQIERLVFNYCETSGSSKGLIHFFKNDLVSFANSHPHIQIIVTPRPSKHPLIKGQFLNGDKKSLCVKNMSPEEIHEHIRLLTEDSRGRSRKPRRGGVWSENPAVRGIWSPFN